MAFFDPTSSERRGLIVLGVALLFVVGVGIVSYVQRDAAATDGTPAFAPSVPHAKNRPPQYYAQPGREVETFPFDPNEADSTMLLRLGFAPWQVRGIYKYRALGGRYHEPADVQHIPGMTHELWDRIAPYVRIGRKYQYVTPAPRTYSRREGTSSETATLTDESRPLRDTVLYPVKLRPGETIDLNEADTTLLKKIPGIGTYYARRIVRYRNELGGFVSPSQLQEIDGMPEDVEQWLRMGTTEVRRIDVNHATRSQLVRHPYIRTYRANDIWTWRHNYGPLRSVDDLRRMPSFTEADIERLRPYLEFK